ncbi:hypothetical protein GCM10028796_55380 [Ramlibacter monticola]|uniref:Spore coat protein U domain-containing protein n=1 Tax=Ramlibacter monticola TaxID=1926872 RepID=A0A937CWY5_9BURK|nr:spore coat protein U domain-containing protein [Ramlibacter monticola]MBL0394923.1 spore coat protein U domain-containing protein [Ramlibacter monticola]
MKSPKIARIAAVALAAAFASAAFAADTQNLVVTANVQSTCKLTAVPAMTFTLDPTVGTDQTQTSAVQYKCTKNTAPSTFTVGGASAAAGYSNTLSGGALGSIPFTLAWTAPSSAGNGLGSSAAAITVTLTGTIVGTDYVNMAAGAYTQSVPVVIAP